MDQCMSAPPSGLAPSFWQNSPIVGRRHLLPLFLHLPQIVTPPFNIVIAADVVYIEESVDHLVGAMLALVADDGVVLLGYQLRSPEADKKFWEVSREVFEIEKVPHEDLHPDYAYEEADVY